LNYTAGVTGTSRDSKGIAGASQSSSGVFGISRDKFGVVGVSGGAGVDLPAPYASTLAGVFGTSVDRAGVIGVSQSGSGVFGFSTGGFAIQGVSATNIAVYGEATKNFAGYFKGDVGISGSLTATVKNAVVPFPDGSQRLLHCMESPEHWFEDFGSARLTRGRATVKLDADFAKTIKLNSCHVFLTPEGDCRGLYVRNKGTGSFEVRELQGGTSSVGFSYRIVGKRKDISRHTRFAKIDMNVAAPVSQSGRRNPPPVPTRVQSGKSMRSRRVKRSRSGS
jgi:hypothetical protein